MARKIGALWVRKSIDGRSFLSGILEDLSGDIQISVFKNDRKEKENQPDYNIVLNEKKEVVKQTQNEDMFSGGFSQSSEVNNDIDVNSIPF